MKSFIILAIILSVFLAGCATHKPPQEEQPPTARGMNAWKGRDISEVIQKWGQPHRVIENRTSGQIYVWHTQWQIGDLRKGQLRYSSLPQAAHLPRSLQRTIKFYVDADGQIYQWSASPDRGDMGH